MSDAKLIRRGRLIVVAVVRLIVLVFLLRRVEQLMRQINTLITNESVFNGYLPEFIGSSIVQLCFVGALLAVWALAPRLARVVVSTRERGCPGCGYLLAGKPVDRCPECGLYLGPDFMDPPVDSDASSSEPRA